MTGLLPAGVHTSHSETERLDKAKKLSCALSIFLKISSDPGNFFISLKQGEENIQSLAGHSLKRCKPNVYYITSSPPDKIHQVGLFPASKSIIEKYKISLCFK
jgi:hypothetical protein